MIAQKPLPKKAQPEVKQSRDNGRQQLIEAFLLLACIVILIGTGLMVYFDGQVGNYVETQHKIELAK